MGTEGEPEEYNYIYIQRHKDHMVGEKYLKSKWFKKYLPLYKSAVEYLPAVDKCGTIIDLGCGVGYLAKVLFEKGYTKYIGIDFSSAMLEEAKKQIPKVTFILGDLRSKEIHEFFKQYKIFIILETLEHIEKDLDIIKDISCGSLVVFSVPSFNSRFHVRYFKDIDEIIERFGSFLDFKESKKIGKKFLFKCIKK